jgi:hypothetical protein
MWKWNVCGATPIGRNSSKLGRLMNSLTLRLMGNFNLIVQMALALPHVSSHLITEVIQNIALHHCAAVITIKAVFIIDFALS